MKPLIHVRSALLMKRKVAAIGFLCLTFLAIGIGRSEMRVLAEETNQQRMERLSREIEQYEGEIVKLQSRASTLSNQIAQYNAQIQLTALKILQTEEKILLLGGRIDQLERSLQSLTNAFTSRVVYTYKMSRLNQAYLLLVSSPDLSALISSFHYLKKIQEADRDLLVRLEKAQGAYEKEKYDEEELQRELENHRQVLGSQKAAKASLLTQTRNDEKRFQQLLANARAEFEAIQAILAGRGDEEEVGNIAQGEKIATVISGVSCNSSGEHLHFIIGQGGNTHNPFNYLKGGVDFENCSGSACGSSDADAFDPGGSWDWPIMPKIKFTQGYGFTWAIANTWVGRIYQFHNGIDVKSHSSVDVRSVAAGTLYRGSYVGRSGCRLRYVRVDHSDSDLDTFYLHINY
jgi:peptidoglycan hydrolase CwlO-like protein